MLQRQRYQQLIIKLLQQPLLRNPPYTLNSGDTHEFYYYPQEQGSKTFKITNNNWSPVPVASVEFLYRINDGAWQSWKTDYLEPSPYVSRELYAGSNHKDLDFLIKVKTIASGSINGKVTLKE